MCRSSACALEKRGATIYVFPELDDAQCSKRGFLANAENVLPYWVSLVSEEWVMNFLQLRKLACACASAEFIKVGKESPTVASQVREIGARRGTRFGAGPHWSVVIEIELLAIPLRKVIAVHAGLAQYKYDTFRYRFLVLEGSRGSGKTQLSMSFSARSLEATCSKCEDPHVRQST